MTSALPSEHTRRARRGQGTPPPRRVALGWVDEDTLTPRPAPTALAETAGGYAPVVADLLGRPPRKPALRPATVIPPVAVLALAGSYVAATLLWPLSAVAPTVTTTSVPAVSAPIAIVTWPAFGEAAVGVTGMGAVAASDAEPAPMASITKIVTVLMVLERAPLALGETGPEFAFTARDRASYWAYLARDESALDVPVGESLTEYQMLQGILIASAGNYADRLAAEYWPDDGAFAAAAGEWLTAQGLSGITVVEPTGINPENAATPAALIALAEKALAHPVIAEIVGTQTATLPGAGEITNTNELVGENGVIGIKTGSLRGRYNLLAAADTPHGEGTLRTTVAVLGARSSDLRFDEAERLLQSVATDAATPRTLAAGTEVATVSTLWGSSATVVTSADAQVTLWNGARAETAADITLGDLRAKDAEVGTATLTGPVDAATVPAHLTATIDDPDALWRLTHPLQLWGLSG